MADWCKQGLERFCASCSFYRVFCNLKLLNKNPVRRLGCGKLDAEEVKKHHFFTGVVFEDVMSMTHPAPWKPKIVIQTHNLIIV